MGGTPYRWRIDGIPGDQGRMGWKRAVEVESRAALNDYGLERSIRDAVRLTLTFKLPRGGHPDGWHIQPPGIGSLVATTVAAIVLSGWWTDEGVVVSVEATKGVCRPGEKPGCDVFAFVETDDPPLTGLSTYERGKAVERIIRRGAG